MKKFTTQKSTFKADRGIALVTALIITLVVFMLIMSTLYMITSSTTMSGAGKRYATAQEAADGAVEVMKDCISLVFLNTPVSTLPLTVASGNLTTTIIEGGPTNVSTVNITLPGSTLSASYKATVTIERLYTKVLPGSRVEFARSGSGVGGTAVYFRISTVVTDVKNNTKAETTALYRYVG